MTRPNKPSPDMAQGLAKVLQSAIKAKSESSDLPEDFNTLVLPDTQEIEQNQILWVWIVHVEEESDYLVSGTLVTKGANKGDYYVELNIVNDTATFVGDEAKNVGKALISAWNYHNVWKDHAGYFIEKQVMGEQEETDG